MSQANQARRENVETTNEAEVVVENEDPTNHVQNYATFRLKQEHVSILSLVDAEVVFPNGEPKPSKKVPLFRLDNLLSEVIPDSEERATTKARVQGCRSGVSDNNDQMQSIVRNDDGRSGDFVVNKKLRSRHELRNSDGPVRPALSNLSVIIAPR